MPNHKFDWQALQEHLQFYQDERLRCFPLLWGDKRPAIKEWKFLQNREATIGELAGWFQEDKPTNIAIVCGGASNGLIALCFNNINGTIEFFGKNLWERLLVSTFIVKTQRGHHVYLRSNIQIPSQFIANKDNLSWLEIRSDGNYIAAPPSLHPSGILYENIGIKTIARPKNLKEFIEDRLTQLGLKSFKAEEPTTKNIKKQKWQHKTDPPCIKSILKGVGEGIRDESTFALALYYLKELELEPAEVLERLNNWNIYNIPPLDDYIVKEKVKSANKPYGFGCSSIKDKLGNFCITEDKCEWLKELQNRYLIKETSKSGKVTIKIDIKTLISDLMDEFIFKTIYGIVRDDILVYENGVYTTNGEKVIRQECEKRVGSPIMTTHSVNEVIGHIARSTFTNRDHFNTEKYIINLENGLLHINTRELKPHTPDFLSTIRIPITYNSQARCSMVDGFLHGVLREQDVNIMLEFFGYALIPDYSIPVVLILLGEGSNGKTQLLRLLGRFIGKSNYTAVSLQDIEDNSFAVANLEGKLLNIQGDLSSKWLSGIGMLKQLSGQDPIYANRKHRDPIQFDNFARLVFASNKPPKIEEDTLAVWRRILPMDLPYKFEGEKDIKDIIEKILTPEELSGLLNLALKGLERLLNRGDFNYHGSFIDRSRHYTIASDPARVFVDECCDIGPELRIHKEELYQAYVKFCGENKIQLSGEAQFGKELRQVPGISISDKQYQESGERVRWWLGIKLKT